MLYYMSYMNGTHRMMAEPPIISVQPALSCRARQSIMSRNRQLNWIAMESA